MLQFQYPQALYLLLLLPIFFAFLFFVQYRKRKLAEKIAHNHLLDKLFQHKSNYKFWVKNSLLILAFLFGVLSLANPQFGFQKEKIQVAGIDVMIAMDLSNSMLCEDLQPNRLERTRRLISRLLDAMPNNRVGLIVFAGNAYLQSPLTIDHSSIKMSLNSVNTKMMPTQGTSIGKAIELAMKSFDEKNSKSKSLIIITDGESHDENAEDMARKANKDGITIAIAGIGTAQGGPIPYGSEYLKDKDGNTVITKMNAELMQKAAKSGNGDFFHINSTNAADAVLAELSKIEKKKMNETTFSNYHSYFQIFTIVAIVLLLIDFLISWSKSQWFSSWQIFKP